MIFPVISKRLDIRGLSFLFKEFVQTIVSIERMYLFRPTSFIPPISRELKMRWNGKKIPLSGYHNRAEGTVKYELWSGCLVGGFASGMYSLRMLRLFQALVDTLL